MRLSSLFIKPKLRLWRPQSRLYASSQVGNRTLKVITSFLVTVGGLFLLEIYFASMRFFTLLCSCLDLEYRYTEFDKSKTFAERVHERAPLYISFQDDYVAAGMTNRLF